MPSKRLKTYFNRLPRRIFGPNEMAQFLAELRGEWGAPDISIQRLLDILLQRKLVTKAEFRSSKYNAIIRYLRGEHTVNELALSLQRDSFLSHGTALTVHGVAAPENLIYVNHEQSPKGRPSGITQAGINLAFRNKQRQSKYIFHYSAVKYMLLSGKHTGRAGVTQAKTPSGETVDVTDKERTLIDIVVRPAYAGGIKRIADTYAKWADEIDVGHMIDLLRRLDHAYPYHQAIGFLLERAGRPYADCQRFEALGKEFDIYLDYGMKRPAFSKKWRLYHPASLD